MPSISLSDHGREMAQMFTEHPMPVRFVRETDDLYLSSVLTGMVAPSSENKDVAVEVFDPALGVVHLSGVVRASALRQLSAYLEAKRADVAASKAGRCLLWIRGCADQLASPESRGALRSLGHEIRRVGANPARIRVLVSGTDEIHPELAPVAAPLELSRPRGDALASYLDQLSAGGPMAFNRADCARALQGLEASAIARIVEEATMHPSDPMRAVFELRDRYIRSSGVVEVLAPRRTFNDLGGLGVMKQWIEDKAFVFEDLDHARNARVTAPRGVLIAGLPGCGKSLSAEVIADRFKVPLLRLDVGRLMGRYLGESESNLRDALAMAEAASPCVLWIDEIEKGLSGAASDEGGGTTSRVLGHLLTWMQEGERGVFVVATANDVDRLPPELLRRGRFDEMFVVGLPSVRERKEILARTTKRRGHALDDHTVAALASDATTRDYSGADLDALVAAACEEAYGQASAPLKLDHFKTVVASGFVPHAKQWGDRLETMRHRLAQHGFKSASHSETEAPPARPRRVRANLPRELRKFMYGEPATVEGWEDGSETFALWFRDDGSERCARLARKPLDGEWLEVGEYLVVPVMTRLHLVPCSGASDDSAREGGPRVGSIIHIRNDGPSLLVEYQRGDDSSFSATMHRPAATPGSGSDIGAGAHQAVSAAHVEPPSVLAGEPYDVEPDNFVPLIPPAYRVVPSPYGTMVQAPDGSSYFVHAPWQADSEPVGVVDKFVNSIKEWTRR